MGNFADKYREYQAWTTTVSTSPEAYEDYLRMRSDADAYGSKWTTDALEIFDFISDAVDSYVPWEQIGIDLEALYTRLIGADEPE